MLYFFILATMIKAAYTGKVIVVILFWRSSLK